MESYKSTGKLNLKISKWLIFQLIILFIFGLNKKFIACFFFIVLHELTHLVVAKFMNLEIRQVKLHCLGATLEIKDYGNLTLKEQIVVCIAGPLFNVTIGLIFFVIWKFLNKDFFMTIVEINLSLAFFNVMPICPLDGFKLILSIFSLKFSYINANKIATFISYITNIFLIVCAIILLVYKYVLAIFIVFICVFSIFTTIKSRKRAMYIVMQGLLKKQEIILRKKYMKNKSISVYCESYSVDLLKFLEKDKFHIFYVLDNNMKILYILKEDEFINILNKYGNIKLKDYYNTRNK